MRKTLRLAICVFALMTQITALCARSESNYYTVRLQPLIEKFMLRQHVPGLAIAIVKDNRIVYAHAFGVRKLDEKKEPLTTQSLFHMASITKPFVATSIMQLVEQGKIDLDAPIVNYLPCFRVADNRYKTITVRELLTHSSGLPDVEDYEWDEPQYDDDALDRYVRSLGNLKLLFPPGEQFRYSNIAFEILGDVVAKVSGESFEGYVQRHILKPLHMCSSTLMLTQADPALLTWGHVLNSVGIPVAASVFPYNRAHSPSSNLLSNVSDMSRWLMANMNRGEFDGTRILRTSTYKVMWTVPNVGRHQPVGISWFIGEHRSHLMVSHGGSDTGYKADLAMLPDQHIAVVWMTNCDWIKRDPLTRAALDTALGFRPESIE